VTELVETCSELDEWDVEDIQGITSYRGEYDAHDSDSGDVTVDHTRK
jgi:hypothetical protein